MLTIAIREPLVQSLKNQCPVKDNGKLIHSCFLYQFLICTEQSQIDDENRRLNGLILVIWSTLDSCGTKADQFITSCQTVHIWCIKSQLQSTNLAVQQTLSSSHKLGWWLGWNCWWSHYSEAQQPRATSSVCKLLDTAYRWDCCCYLLLHLHHLPGGLAGGCWLADCQGLPDKAGHQTLQMNPERTKALMNW